MTSDDGQGADSHKYVLSSVFCVHRNLETELNGQSVLSPGDANRVTTVERQS